MEKGNEVKERLIEVANQELYPIKVKLSGIAGMFFCMALPTLLCS